MREEAGGGQKENSCILSVAEYTSGTFDKRMMATVSCRGDEASDPLLTRKA